MKRRQLFAERKEEHSREKQKHVQRPGVGIELEILGTARPGLAGM